MVAEISSFTWLIIIVTVGTLRRTTHEREIYIERERERLNATKNLIERMSVDVLGAIIPKNISMRSVSQEIASLNKLFLLLFLLLLME